eukprot:scaffold67977_cov16-Prasinocladus_malaysianus.AAC.1
MHGVCHDAQEDFNTRVLELTVSGCLQTMSGACRQPQTAGCSPSSEKVLNERDASHYKLPSARTSGSAIKQDIRRVLKDRMSEGYDFRLAGNVMAQV